MVLLFTVVIIKTVNSNSNTYIFHYRIKNEIEEMRPERFSLIQNHSYYTILDPTESRQGTANLRTFDPADPTNESADCWSASHRYLYFKYQGKIKEQQLKSILIGWGENQ